MGLGKGGPLCSIAKSETSSVSSRKHSRGRVLMSCHTAASSGRKQFIMGGGALVCTPFQDCISQPLVQLQFGRWHSTRFLQEAGRWSCSGIKADLLHCLCEEVHCHFLASFTQTLPKMLPYPEPNTAQWERLVANRTWEKLFVQNLNNILCQNKCDNGLLCLAP